MSTTRTATTTVGTHRKTATLVGALYILAAVTSIAALVQYAPILSHPGYVTAGSPHVTQVASGAFLEVILAFSLIGISAAMFPIVKKYNDGVALGFACFRLLEATVIIVGAMSLLSVVTLSRQFTKAARADTASYLIASRSLVAQHDWTFLFGPNLALGPSTALMAYSCTGHRSFRVSSQSWA